MAAPITSGDTALRSARLIAADFSGIKQKKVISRVLVSLPIFAVCFIIMLLPYDVLWRYFAWCNQALSVFTLWAITVWLASRKRFYGISLVPALFMTVVTVSYILFAPEGLGLLTQALFGVGIDYWLAIGIGVAVALTFLVMFLTRKVKAETETILDSQPSTLK